MEGNSTDECEEVLCQCGRIGWIDLRNGNFQRGELDDGREVFREDLMVI